MDSSADPWDADYRRRGRLWGGSIPFCPPVPQSGRILELGSGDGRMVAALVQAGGDVFAADLSPHAARLCRSSCTEPDKAGICIADTRQNPFRDASFDVVIASHIAGHLDREGRACLAGEVLRLLVPGGRLFFRDFSVRDFRYGRGARTDSATFIRKNGITTHYFTAPEVRALFSGLVLRSETEHRWEMRVRKTVFPRAEIVAEFEKPR